MSHKLVLIEWADASHPQGGGWVDPEDYSHDEMVIFSIGWILDETPTAITIASTITTLDEGKVQGMQIIPMTQIRNQSVWKAGKR